MLAFDDIGAVWSFFVYLTSEASCSIGLDVDCWALC